jgi:F0F1-type ATP synthase gamma subunit
MESSMASVINQSRYVVRVKRRPDLYREFPHTKKSKAEAYKLKLKSEEKLDAEMEQLSNQLLVRVRRKGYPEQTFRAAITGSATERARKRNAEQFATLNAKPGEATSIAKSTLP